MVKNPPANARDARDMGSIPESGSSPRVRNGNPLPYSSLGNPMDRGAWWAVFHRVAKIQTQIENELVVTNWKRERERGQINLGIKRY